VLQAGVGLGVHRTHADYPMHHRRVSRSARPCKSSRLSRCTALLPSGFTSWAQVVSAPQEQAVNSFEDQTYIGIEAGVSGSVVLDRVTLSPWLGLQSLHSKRYRAAGLIGAYDVRSSATRDRGTRVRDRQQRWISSDNWPISDVGVLVASGTGMVICEDVEG